MNWGGERNTDRQRGGEEEEEEARKEEARKGWQDRGQAEGGG